MCKTNLWIMYHEKDVNKNKWFIDTFIDRCRSFKIQAELVTVEKYLLSHDLTFPEGAVARMINPKVSKDLENRGVRVFNSYRVSYISNNKAECMRHIHSLGIEHIPTLVPSRRQDGTIRYEIIADGYPDKRDNIFGKLTDNRRYDDMPDYEGKLDRYVIKSVTGHGGKEVMLLSDYLKQKTKFGEQEKHAGEYYADKCIIQPLIMCDGRDLRVYITGGRITGAVLRQSAGGFKSNYSLGGKVSLYTLDRKQENIVNTITSSLYIDYGGIDFLVCGEDDRLVFNEIEDVAGARMLDKCSEIDYIGGYVSHIKDVLYNSGQS